MENKDSSPPQENEMLQRRLEESRRLSKFFTKLLGEMEHLQGEMVVFYLEAKALRAEIQRARTCLKSINIKPVWQEPICRWLADRAWCATGVATATAAVGLSEKFAVALRLPDRVAIANGRRLGPVATPYALELSGVEWVSIPTAIARIGFLPYAQKNCYDLVRAASGIILVSAPDQENLKKTCAAMLSLSDGLYLGALNDLSLKPLMMNTAVQFPLIVSVQAGDALDALLKVKEYGYNLDRMVIAGSLCQGFVRRSCQNCAREAAVDPKLIEDLPSELRPSQDTVYLIGRGCTQCDMSGYQGSIGVQSLLVMDAVLREKLILGEGQVALIRHLYPLGLRSLLEDGINKVKSGLTTYAALYELTRTVSPAFLKVIAEIKSNTGGGRGASENLAATFPRGPAVAAYKPSTSVQAGDQPLFTVGPGGKARPKPLLLIVEDDPDQRNILDLLFRSAGYDTLLAADGVEALSQLEQDLPDLVVTDLMMPKMDGMELVSRLKAHPLYRRIPVLVLTVVSDGDREFSLLDLGADDYCEKTVQRKILLKRTEKLLRRGPWSQI